MASTLFLLILASISVAFGSSCPEGYSLFTTRYSSLFTRCNNLPEQCLKAGCRPQGCVGRGTRCVSKPLYAPTPAGHILAHCVHQVPEGSHISTTTEGVMSARLPDGTLRQFPVCETLNGTLPVRVARPNNYGGTPLPPDYDGWLQYTAVNVSKLGLTGGFDGFSNVMSVPDLPKSRPQILYLFPGLQNIDWIPKVSLPAA